MRRISGALLLGCLGSALASSGCDPVSASPSTIDHAFGDAGVPMLAASEVMSNGALADTRATPAPAILPVSAGAPSGATCRVGHPPGDCDRCPGSACRQVYVVTGHDEREWVAFCEQGSVREQALIACLCAGGDEFACTRASQQTAGALALLTNVFGGRVPPIGTRYRDEYGLRAYVDEEMHEWLAAVASPEATFRCDTPDVVAAEARYAERSLRVRRTGTCDE